MKPPKTMSLGNLINQNKSLKKEGDDDILSDTLNKDKKKADLKLGDFFSSN